MQIEIAKAAPADIPALVEVLTLATHYKLHHKDHSWGARPFTPAEVGRNLSIGGTYKAVLRGEIVGTFELVWRDEEVWGEQPPVAGYLHRLAVKEGRHGQGLGTQIIGWAAAEVKRRSLRFLRLDCDSRNLKLRNYYEQQGFVLAEIKRVSAHKNYLSSLYQLKI
jgi:GNAT superfamily N-acetyltransferase